MPTQWRATLASCCAPALQSLQPRSTRPVRPEPARRDTTRREPRYSSGSALRQRRPHLYRSAVQTGLTQKRTRITARRTSADNPAGTRNGFGGARYQTTTVDSPVYADSFDDYLAFLRPRLIEAHRLLTPTGSFFLHLDPREVHYAKVMLDQIFGRDCFRNEIIWAYDYGGKPRDRWPAKHDNLLWYSRSPENYTFHYDAIDRVPYMAPELVGPEKAARGKIPTECGGSRWSRPTRARRPATPRRSRSSSWSASFACTPNRTTSCWTSSPVAGRRVRPPPIWAAASSSIDSSRDAVRVMRKRLGKALGIS